MSDALPVPSSPAPTNRRLVWIVLGLFALVSLALSVSSSGFLEADGITHYLYARWAFVEPHLFVNVWGRPVVTTLHSIGAQLPGTILGLPAGLVGVRATSMVIAIVTAILAWRVAVGQGPQHGHDRPGLAAVFLVLQPLVILHSISELTELPFALLAVLGLLAYQRRWWWVLALAIGCSPAARPEGFGLILMAAGALVLHRRWEILLLPIPLIVWDRLGWWFYGGEANDQGPWWGLFMWLKQEWPYSGDSAYEAGPLLKFVGMLPAVTGPMLLPFMLIGTVAIARRWSAWRDHGTRVALVTAFVPWFVLIVHSVLHWTGKMASSGDVRYLVAVAPFWALLAARGFDVTWRLTGWRYGMAFALGFAALPPIVAQVSYPIVPLELDRPGNEAVEVAGWYLQSDLAQQYPNLMTDHPIVWYRLDVNPQRGGGGKAFVREARPGSLYLWHEIYSQYNADDRYVVPPGMPPEHGWNEITPPEMPAGWKVFAVETE